NAKRYRQSNALPIANRRYIRLQICATEVWKLEAPITRRLEAYATLSFVSHIPRVAQTVSKKAPRQQRGNQNASWNNDQPPVYTDRVDLADTLGHQGPPAGERRLQSHATVTP